MRGLIDRVIITLTSLLLGALIIGNKIGYTALIAIIALCFLYFFQDSIMHLFFMGAAGLCIVLDDRFIPIFVLLVYECAVGCFQKKWKEPVVFGIICGVYGITFLSQNKFFISELVSTPVIFSLFIINIIVAVYLAFQTYACEKADKIIKKMRDDNEEYHQLMVNKNKIIREHQNSEIMVATLKERNRIAREIHDNVGHLLSRSILQMGALQAVYKEEPLATGLRDISATLNESMNSIRSSVHDLHNEAFDLKKGIEEVLDKQDKFHVFFDYDMNFAAPKEIKYCILSIVQEGMNNAIKHSDGDSMDIIVHEHPAFYQVTINDNGHPKKIVDSGIGLHNMKSRVEELDGTITFTTERGFKIFLTIPKKGEQIK